MRSSIALRRSARPSNSSLLPVSGMRWEKSPEMMFARGAVHRIDTPQHAVAHQGAAPQGNDQGHSHGNQRRFERTLQQGLLLVEVPTHQQVVGVWQPSNDDPNRVGIARAVTPPR